MPHSTVLQSTFASSTYSCKRVNKGKNILGKVGNGIVLAIYKYNSGHSFIFIKLFINTVLLCKPPKI